MEGVIHGTMIHISWPYGPAYRVTYRRATSPGACPCCVPGIVLYSSWLVQRKRNRVVSARREGALTVQEIYPTSFVFLSGPDFCLKSFHARNSLFVSSHWTSGWFLKCYPGSYDAFSNAPKKHDQRLLRGAFIQIYVYTVGIRWDSTEEM